MSVCLTKPFKGFEFTPVHICDEVYPNSILQERKSVCSDRAEITKFMYEAMT